MKKQKLSDGIAEVRVVEIDSLAPRYSTPEDNPNKMDPERYTLLVQAIKEAGFLQPLTVVELPGGKYRIEDGHHRWWAAKQAGLSKISIAIKAADDAHALLLGIGMNRLRGELDLAATADIIREVQSMIDIPMPEISTYTGFTIEELGALLVEPATPEEILDDAASEVTVDTEAPSAAFVLEITFANRDEYKLCRRKLRKMGKGDLAVGLLAALGEHEEA